jgi:hypothetical protein
MGNGAAGGPISPMQPRSPPARAAISIATCHMSSAQLAWTPCVLWLVACLSPRLIAPWLGFSATLPQ